MPPVTFPPEAAAKVAELTDITGLSEAELSSIWAQPAPDQAILFADWQALGKLSWAQKPDTLSKVMAILGILGTIVGVASGVEGAVGGAAGMIQALKAL